MWKTEFDRWIERARAGGRGRHRLTGGEAERRGRQDAHHAIEAKTNGAARGEDYESWHERQQGQQQPRGTSRARRATRVVLVAGLAVLLVLVGRQLVLDAQDRVTDAACAGVQKRLGSGGEDRATLTAARSAIHRAQGYQFTRAAMERTCPATMTRLRALAEKLKPTPPFEPLYGEVTVEPLDEDARAPGVDQEDEEDLNCVERLSGLVNYYERGNSSLTREEFRSIRSAIWADCY